MTPTATTPRRASAPRPSRRARQAQRAAARRRRVVAVLGALALGTGGAVAIREAAPERAVREITLPLQHEDVIRQQARDKDLDPALIAAVIYTESRFRDRTSPAGAKGLMQILPGTAHFIANRSGGTRFELRDLASPQINIAYGSWYLRFLIDEFDGDETLAIAAYNAGSRHVQGWVADAGGPEAFEPDRHIRFPETRAYVQRVRDARARYRERYSRELGL